jgi:hypothetical protein
MKSSRFFVNAVARAVLLTMTAFTLVVAVRVLSDEEHQGVELPPGHPPIDECLRLPPGHPPVDGLDLPPGHSAEGEQGLPPGHPPVDQGARSFRLFPQDGTSSI